MRNMGELDYSDLDYGLPDSDPDFTTNTNLTLINHTDAANTTLNNNSSILDYDYVVDFSHPLEELVPVSLVYGGTLVLGMVGNLLVIFSVTRYEQMVTVTNTFLLSLASADLLLVMICVPVKGLDNNYVVDFSHPLEELVPVSLVYGGTLVLGMVGNLLVIFSVTRYEQMVTVTNTFLLSLASADLLLVMICVPVKFAAFFSFSWKYGEFMCKSVHYIQDVSAICSVTTLTFMSLERYYAIIHPMKAKYSCTVGKARRVCIFIWFLSFALAVPILVGRVHITVGTRRKATWCIKEWSEPLYSVLYELYMFAIILFLPVVIMSFAYIRICIELWNITRHRSVMRNESTIRYKAGQPINTKSHPTSMLKVKFVDDDNTKKQVIKMLVAIIIVFVICWAPITINNLLVAFNFIPVLNVGYLKYMREVFHILSYANSCVNPIVYGFMSKNFRQTFRRSLRSCTRGKEFVRREFFKTQTEASYMSDDSYTYRGAGVENRGILTKQCTLDEDLMLDIDCDTTPGTSDDADLGDVTPGANSTKELITGV